MRTSIQAIQAKRPGSGPRTVFILPGGGARGAAQAGALSVLLRAGIAPDLIFGVSAGSWNGAHLAQHPTVEGSRELENFWKETTTRDILGSRRWQPAVSVLGRRTAFYGTASMAQVATRHLGDSTFADCVVPLHILAADLTTGTPHFFAEGRLVDAVLASSAMPGVFPPVMIGGGSYIDGGIVDWAACLAAVEAGAQRVVLVTCGSSALHRAPSRQTYRRVFERSMEIGTRQSFQHTTFTLRAAGIDVIAVHPELDHIGLLDFDQAPALIAAGHRGAELALAEWQASRVPEAQFVARPVQPSAWRAWAHSSASALASLRRAGISLAFGSRTQPEVLADPQAR